MDELSDLEAEMFFSKVTIPDGGPKISKNDQWDKTPADSLFFI